jgi:hypothetical protein
VADSKQSVNAAATAIDRRGAGLRGAVDLSTIPVDISVDFAIWLPAAPLIPPLFSLCPKKVQMVNSLI